MNPARVMFAPEAGPGYSPYRVVDGNGCAAEAINEFLDAQALRNLSPRSLRAYAFDLLNFARWWLPQKSDLASLTESRLAGYIRYQLQSQPEPTPTTVNHRLVAVRCLYRFHAGRDLAPRADGGNPVSYSWRARRTRSFPPALKLKEPRRVVNPLSPDEVLKFWRSFRCYRDLCIVGLMLASGLRSREVLDLLCADVVPAQACMRVRGKGNKERVVPLSQDTIRALSRYVEWERPDAGSPYLFVCLKGTRRGQAMTPAGFRSLFRHHRKVTGIHRGNPHRFRHTFGTDMVRAGVALPALMHLMGHASIRTTLQYTHLSREDVWRQYRSAMETLRHPPVTVKP